MGWSNPGALRNMSHKSATGGIYHTGDEKSAVGTATVVSVETPHPKNPIMALKAASDRARRLPRPRSKPTRGRRITAGPPGQAGVVPRPPGEVQILDGNPTFREEQIRISCVALLTV